MGAWRSSKLYPSTCRPCPRSHCPQEPGCSVTSPGPLLAQTASLQEFINRKGHSFFQVDSAPSQPQGEAQCAVHNLNNGLPGVPPNPLAFCAPHPDLTFA